MVSVIPVLISLEKGREAYPRNGTIIVIPAKTFLPWPPLVSGKLLRRYHRFLADVRLEDGRRVTAHCPNSGSMKECCEEGRPVYLSVHNTAGRKLKYTWELIQMPGSLVGVNTLIPNRLVNLAVRTGEVKSLSGYDRLLSEVRVSSASRIDLMLEKRTGGKCYVEVKNCTLVQDGVAAFPDAVTLRGKKHLEELRALVDQGHRCVIFFLIQRMDAREFRPADRIDPAYGRALREAHADGVEILVYDVRLTQKAIALNKPVPCRLVTV